MRRKRTVCNHPERQTIEEAMLSGESFRSDSLSEYVRNLSERMERLFVEVESILEHATGARDLKTAISAIRKAANITRKARANATRLGQLTGKLQQDITSPVQIVCPGFRPEDRSGAAKVGSHEAVVPPQVVDREATED